MHKVSRVNALTSVFGSLTIVLVTLVTVQNPLAALSDLEGLEDIVIEPVSQTIEVGGTVRFTANGVYATSTMPIKASWSIEEDTALGSLGDCANSKTCTFTAGDRAGRVQVRAEKTDLNGTYLFGANASVEITKKEEPITNPFKDDLPGWAQQSVLAMHKLDIIKGYDDGRFGPSDPVTNGQVVALLTRILKHTKLIDEPENCTQVYDDVAADHYAFIPTCLFHWQSWADRTALFGPDAPSSRGKTAQFISRVIAPSFTGGSVPPEEQYFDDVPLSHPFYSDTAMARYIHIMEGNPDGSFGVDAPLNRAAAAVVMQRVLAKIQSEELTVLAGFDPSAPMHQAAPPEASASSIDATSSISSEESISSTASSIPELPTPAAGSTAVTLIREEIPYDFSEQKVTEHHADVVFHAQSDGSIVDLLSHGDLTRTASEFGSATVAYDALDYSRCFWDLKKRADRPSVFRDMRGDFALCVRTGDGEIVKVGHLSGSPVQIQFQILGNPDKRSAPPKAPGPGGEAKGTIELFDEFAYYDISAGVYRGGEDEKPYDIVMQPNFNSNTLEVRAANKEISFFTSPEGYEKTTMESCQLMDENQTVTRNDTIFIQSHDIWTVCFKTEDGLFGKIGKPVFSFSPSVTGTAEVVLWKPKPKPVAPPDQSLVSGQGTMSVGPEPVFYDFSAQKERTSPTPETVDLAFELVPFTNIYVTSYGKGAATAYSWAPYAQTTIDTCAQVLGDPGLYRTVTAVGDPRSVLCFRTGDGRIGKVGKATVEEQGSMQFEFWKDEVRYMPRQDAVENLYESSKGRIGFTAEGTSIHYDFSALQQQKEGNDHADVTLAWDTKGNYAMISSTGKGVTRLAFPKEPIEYANTQYKHCRVALQTFREPQLLSFLTYYGDQGGIDKKAQSRVMCFETADGYIGKIGAPEATTLWPYKGTVSFEMWRKYGIGGSPESTDICAAIKCDDGYGCTDGLCRPLSCKDMGGSVCALGQQCQGQQRTTQHPTSQQDQYESEQCCIGQCVAPAGEEQPATQFESTLNINGKHAIDVSTHIFTDSSAKYDFLIDGTTVVPREGSTTKIVNILTTYDSVSYDYCRKILREKSGEKMVYFAYTPATFCFESDDGYIGKMDIAYKHAFSRDARKAKYVFWKKEAGEELEGKNQGTLQLNDYMYVSLRTMKPLPNVTSPYDLSLERGSTYGAPSVTVGRHKDRAVQIARSPVPFNATTLSHCQAVLKVADTMQAYNPQQRGRFTIQRDDAGCARSEDGSIAKFGNLSKDATELPYAIWPGAQVDAANTEHPSAPPEQAPATSALLTQPVSERITFNQTIYVGVPQMEGESTQSSDHDLSFEIRQSMSYDRQCRSRRFRGSKCSTVATPVRSLTISPLNDAKIVWMAGDAFDAMTEEKCKSTLEQRSNLSVGEVKSDMTICFKTPEGHIGKLGNGSTSGIDYTLWK